MAFFRVRQSGQGVYVVVCFFCYYIKQIDSMLPCVCSVIDHRRRQNVVRASVTHSAIAPCATFLFLSHYDVIYDLLLNRRTATWNLFVKYTTRKIRTKPHPGLEWRIFHILTSEDIDAFGNIKFVS